MTDKIYMDVTDSSNIMSVTVNTSHSAQSSTAIIETVSTSVDIGDLIEVDIGYVGNHQKVFKGYVKNLERKEPERTYNITASDVLVRAMDFFIASSDPDNPFKRQNIAAEILVKDVLALAGLTNYDYDPTSFTFAIGSPLEINLTSSYDYCRFIADILAWHLYADEDGVVHFIDRKPYFDGDTPIGTISLTRTIENKHATTDKNLRNRVLVYGASGISAEASASSPYLPAGFYKTVVVAAPQVFDNQSMAQQAADYNLALYNRLTEFCNVSVAGDPSYLARRAITFNNANIGASGDWYIFSADHQISQSGYTVNMELRK